MPNPDRPVYQEVIASTWGLAVADTVVRRYASSAERDADLAGFTAAALDGQVVAVSGDLEVHTGGRWMPVPASIGGLPGLLVQAGSYVGTTDAFGSLTLTFPQAFPATIITIVAIAGDTGVGFVVSKMSGLTRTSALFSCYTQAGNGAIAGNGTVRVNWIAYGT